MKTMRICQIEGVTRQDQWRSVYWMLGATSAVMILAFLLRAQVGRTVFTDALQFSSYPIALALSTRCTYLKRYSPAAQNVLVGASIAFVLAITTFAVWLGYRL